MSDNVQKLLKIKAHGGHATPEILSFLDHEDPQLRKEVLAHIQDIPEDKLKKLVHDPYQEVALHALHHPNAWEPHLNHALESTDPTIHAAVAAHPKITTALLNKILGSYADFEVKRLAVKNKHNTSKAIGQIIQSHLHGDPDANRLALEAIAHPKALDSDIYSVIVDPDVNVDVRAMAANHIKSPDVIIDLLNAGVPKAVENVLLLNRKFNKSDWWKLKDQSLRNQLRHDADV